MLAVDIFRRVYNKPGTTRPSTDKDSDLTKLIVQTGDKTLKTVIEQVTTQL